MICSDSNVNITGTTPEYIIEIKDFQTKIDIERNNTTDEQVKKLLIELGEKNNLKKYFYTNDTTLKIYIGNI